MKQIVLSALIFTTIAFQSYSQGTEGTAAKHVNAPNFLVHNQLTPELLKIEYAGGLSSGTLKNSDHGVSYFKQNTLTVSGYPVTLISKPHQQLYVGFGYTRDRYTETNSTTGPAFSEQTFHSVNVNIFMNTRIKQRLYWFSYLQVGVQGSNPFDGVSSSHNEIFLNKINYKVKRNMNIGVGVTYVSNLGKPLILPAVAFVYSTRHYLINIDFPAKAEVEGIFANGKWRPVAGVSFPAATYHMKNVNEYFSTTGLTGYVGTRYRVLDYLYLYAAYQTGLGETFKYGQRNDRKEIASFNGQSRFVVSVNLQVARFIPNDK